MKFNPGLCDKFSTERINLLGEKLIVAVTDNSPHVLKNFTMQTDPWKVGYEIKILQELRRWFNFTYELIDTNGDSGVLFPNGSWSGVIGYLVEDRADIGFGGVTITQDREKVVDYFDPPHFTSPITFITSWPKNEASIFFIQIDNSIMVCLAISVIMIILTIKLIALYHENVNKVSIFWTILIIALRQDIRYKMPMVYPLRIVICIWMFTALVVSLVLSGHFFKAFSAPKKLETIDSLSELSQEMQSGSISVLINMKSARYDEMKKSSRGIIQKIYTRLKGLEKGQKGEELVRESKKNLAYIDYRIKFDYERHKKDKKTYHVPPDDPDANIRNAWFGFAVKRSFKYKCPFRKHYRRIVMSGHIIYLLRRQKYAESFVYHGEFGDKSEEKKDNDQGKLPKSIVYFSLFGILTSFLVLLIEFIFNKLRKQNRLFVSSSNRRHYLTRSLIRRMNKNYHVN